MRPTLLLCVLALGCSDVRRPDETEAVFADEHVSVTTTLVDHGGLTDRVVDYDVRLQAGARTLTVMHGASVQAQSVSHQVRAARVGAMIAVALGDGLCVVDDEARSSACIDLGELEPGATSSGAIAEAIAWRASDPSIDERDRQRAADALAPRVRGRSR